MNYTKEYTDFTETLKRDAKQNKTKNLRMKLTYQVEIKEAKDKILNDLQNLLGENEPKCISINNKMIFHFSHLMNLDLTEEKIKFLTREGSEIKVEIEKIIKLTEEKEQLEYNTNLTGMCLKIGENKRRRSKIDLRSTRHWAERETAVKKLIKAYEIVGEVSTNPLMKIHCKEMKLVGMFNGELNKLTKEQERRDVIFANELHIAIRNKENEIEKVVKQIGRKVEEIFRRNEFEMKYKIMEKERDVLNVGSR